MKNLFHRILKTLNINGRDWVVLLLALLLAFSIWLIHNLALKYNDHMSVSVVASCNIPGHASVSADKVEVTARCRATGYKVIRSYIRRGKNVEVQFKSSDVKHKDGDIFYVTPADLKDYSHLIFGPEISVEYFVTDTLFFRFPYENYKKVPVVPISTITYSDQYMAESPLAVSPDSVLVYGEPFRLENISAVYTRPVNYVALSEDVSGSVKLEQIKDVRISETEVRYELKVKRFVEVICTVPVKVINVPEGKNMYVYPSEVDVLLKCNFPLVDNPERGIRVVADYNDLHKSLTQSCILKVHTPSRGVISCEASPVSVSCVWEDK